MALTIDRGIRMADTESSALAKPLRAKSALRKRTADTSYLKAPKVVPGGAVVYIGRLPHGFYETELREYLAQFGEITRLRVSRNPRTGASRHYAFVEFRHAEVGRIVVETMQNYLLSGHILQCKLMSEEKIHQELWKGANRRFVPVPWRKWEVKRFNGRLAKTPREQVQKRCQQLLAGKKQKCQKAGIEYDFDGVLAGPL